MPNLMKQSSNTNKMSVILPDVFDDCYQAFLNAKGYFHILHRNTITP